MAERCYVGDPVKGRIWVSLENSVLHRKLLFDRDGFCRQISQQVRFAKRLCGESRIILRDGIGYSSVRAIAALGGLSG